MKLIKAAKKWIHEKTKPEEVVVVPDPKKDTAAEVKKVLDDTSSTITASIALIGVITGLSLTSSHPAILYAVGLFFLCVGLFYFAKVLLIRLI